MSDYALALSDAEIARYQRMAESAHRAEADLWSAAGIRAGAVVADIGCGPGAMSTVIAGLVGPTGQVWAVDQDPGAVAAAQGLAAKVGLDNVRFQEGNAAATGLDAASVDVVIMRHVLAHNGGREQAIVNHLASLVRPGGSVYLVDVEVTGLRVRPDLEGLEDLGPRYHDFQAARGNDLSIGLRLGDLLTDAGLELVEHRGRYDIIPASPGFRPPSWAAREAMVQAGAADQSDIERWSAAFERLDQGGAQLTIFVPVFCALGRRPA